MDSSVKLRGKGSLLNMGNMIEPSLRSPSGNLIMTKLPRAIKIWTQDGVCRKTIERKRPVQSVAWMPQGEGKPVWTCSEWKIDGLNIHDKRSYLLKKTALFVWCVDPNFFPPFYFLNIDLTEY
jgi:hypothetical protein